MVNEVALPACLHSQVIDDGEGGAWRVRRVLLKRRGLVMFLESGQRRVRASWNGKCWTTSSKVPASLLAQLAPRDERGKPSEETKAYVMDFAHVSKSRAELAAATGRSATSVGNIVRSAGMRQVWRKRWTDDEIAELRSMRDDGATVREMSEWFGRPPQGVVYRLKKLEEEAA